MKALLLRRESPDDTHQTTLKGAPSSYTFAMEASALPSVAAEPRNGVHRTLAMLSVFSASDRELSSAELARRTGLPRSSAHRIALDLADIGLLERTVNGHFRLGMRLFELGHLALYQRGLRESASSFLADLSSATRSTVHLAVIEQLEVVYLDIIRPTGAPELRSRLGGRLPPSATAVGKAILAFSPASLVDSVIAAGLPRLTPHSITTGEQLRAELNTIRQSGIALDQEEQAAGTLCCAAPIFGPNRKVVAAVSVSGHASSLRLDRVKMAVRSTAAGISRRQNAVAYRFAEP